MNTVLIANKFSSVCSVPPRKQFIRSVTDLLIQVRLYTQIVFLLRQLLLQHFVAVCHILLCNLMLIIEMLYSCTNQMTMKIMLSAAMGQIKCFLFQNYIRFFSILCSSSSSINLCVCSKQASECSFVYFQEVLLVERAINLLYKKFRCLFMFLSLPACFCAVIGLYMYRLQRNTVTIDYQNAINSSTSALLLNITGTSSPYPVMAPFSFAQIRRPFP